MIVQPNKPKPECEHYYVYLRTITINNTPNDIFYCHKCLRYDGVEDQSRAKLGERLQ